MRRLGATRVVDTIQGMPLDLTIQPRFYLIDLAVGLECSTNFTAWYVTFANTCVLSRLLCFWTN